MQDLAADQLIQLAELLSDAAQWRFERRLLVLSGDSQATRRDAELLLHYLNRKRSLWVGADAPKDVNHLRAAQALKALGGENDCIVFDAWSGFHPDAFCALAGTLAGGGLLLLLTPPLALWAGMPDPDYARMVPYGFLPTAVPGYFLQRLDAALRESPFIALWNSDDRTAKYDPPDWQKNQACADTLAAHAIARQTTALEQLVAVADLPPVPCIITADRGRGKSALLGRLASRWSLLRGLRVVVTAAQPEAAQQVMRWAHEEALALGWEGFTLPFIAPDALLLPPPLQQPNLPIDAVFLDEAAMLPVSMLQKLLTRYPRMIMASTLHGYEGSGRGLALKLFPWLQREWPCWQNIQLDYPMRWSQYDPLERWLGEVFCLNDDAPLTAVVSDAWSVRQVSSKELSENPTLLHAAFGLLVSAHYRTTPSDLRDLLDGPNLELWLLHAGLDMAGVCLVAREGPFDDAELCTAILAGKRRPRGHLLPQMIAFHCHSPLLLRCACARIVRIAIAPALQGKGLGKRLLHAVEQAMRAQGVRVLGSSFALEPHVLRFWQHMGMSVLRVGATRESASGLPSCVVAKALSTTNDEPETLTVVKEIRVLHDQFRWEAPRVLAAQLPMLERDMVIRLCAGDAPMAPQAHSRLHARVRRFSTGGLPFESAFGALWYGWAHRKAWVRGGGMLDGISVPALVTEERIEQLVLGRLSLKAFAQQCELLGRDAAIALLRDLFAQFGETGD